MTSATFCSSNCGAQGAVGERNAATSRANAAAVRYPRLLCGPLFVVFFLQAPIFNRASHKFPNQLAFKHSSGNFPCKLSTCAFCAVPARYALPRSSSPTPTSENAQLVKSGPLSQRIACGASFRHHQLQHPSQERSRKTLSTCKTKHSRVYRSVTLSTRNYLPLSAASCTKSIAYSCFAPVTIDRTKPARSNRFLRFRRINGPASRYTRLWFTVQLNSKIKHN